MSWDDVKPCWFTSWGNMLPVSPERGDSPVYRSRTFASRLERMHVREHMQAHIPTLQHTHTHMLRTHARFHLIPTFSWSSSGETLICGPQIVYPLDILLMGVARVAISFFVFDCVMG